MSELAAHEMCDRPYRSAVIHQLAEQRAQQKYRKESCDELCSTAHECLRPMGEQGLLSECHSDERHGRREEQHAPASEREPEEETKGNENSDEAHGVKPAANNEPFIFRASYLAAPHRSENWAKVRPRP